jgi:catechol 2,3-dioxygenase-like lactoylglutathione lyase family enzyme
MFDHLGIQAADVEAALDFYQGVFAPLGLHEVVRYPAGDSFFIGLAQGDGPPKFWLGPAAGAETRELHFAFTAPDQASVEAVHAAAVERGVEVLNAPREFPEYHPGYYGVFLRDLDGHNVEAVYHGAPPT